VNIQYNSYDERVKTMGKSPYACPMCGEVMNWKKIDTAKKGLSVGKGVVGAVLFGPVGLLGAALGKKHTTYYCGKCSFKHEYQG